MPEIPGERRRGVVDRVAARAHGVPDGTADRRPEPYTEPTDAAGLLDELERLSKLHAPGALADEQFEAVKARLLA